MLCRNPYMRNGMAHGCGQCMPCRVNRRRIWVHRLLLEGYCHSDSTFLTLTYSDENLTEVPDKSTGELYPTLVPKHLQDFLKRLRKAHAPEKIRFFAVGEYGDQTERPHYHLAVFGFPNCRYGTTTVNSRGQYCCGTCRMVHDTWGFGNVYLGELTPESSNYVAGYVTKKMTAKDDFRLKGRHPEFARMSNRPGIGANFLHEIASTLMQFDLEDRQADVPSALRHGSRLLPLGRYLKSKLRTLVGHDEKTPDSVLEEIFEKLSPMREAAETIASQKTGETYGQALKRLIIEASDQKVANMAARQKLNQKRKPL